MKYFFLTLLFLIQTLGFSQGNEVVHIDFNSCLTQNSGNLADPVVSGATSCDCGPVGESIYFNGSSSSMEFDTNYTDFFQQDFTLSFYFMLDESVSGIVDILSISESCQIDSSMSIKYIPDESEIRVQMAKDFELFVELKGKVNLDKCWHQLVFQRRDKNYDLFIDGVFASSDFTNGQIVLSPQATLKFNDSPCQAIGEKPFNGKIDEFKIYNTVIPVEQITGDFIIQDQILTRDTTVYSGSTITISQFPTCSDDIIWNPTLNVESYSDLEPNITPDATTLYKVHYEYGLCRGVDSINIAVIDEDLVDCDNLLVPNAFTPNNDGLNDVLEISNSFIIQELKSFEIFDRWGEKVFESSIKTEGWDGTLRDKKVNPNVYLYKINYTCQDQEYNITGSVAILR